MNVFKYIAAIIAAMVLVVHPATADRLYIDIAAPGIKPLPTAIPNLKTLGDLPASEFQPQFSVAEELRRDLAAVGEFDLIGQTAYLEDSQSAPFTPNDASFDSWTQSGAQLLIKGQVSMAGPNEYRVELHAWDVARRAFVLGKKYRSPARAVNETAHMFANALMEELTGKPGSFGTEIAFVAKKGNSKNIATVKMNGSGFRMLTQNSSLNMNPVWARDGVSIYVTSYYGGRPDLCRVHIPSREIRYVYRNDGASMPGEESPDGRKLLLASTAEQNTDVYLLDLATRGTTRLTTNRAIDVSPVWSPDGKRFAYVSDMRGSPHIFTGNAENPDEAPVRITFEGRHNGDPAWSPDGQKIAYTGMDENGVFQVYISDPEGRSHLKLTNGKHDTQQPAWSPDGRFLAVTSNRDGKDAIYVMRLGVDKLVKISPPGVEASQPAWSYGYVAK